MVEKESQPSFFLCFLLLFLLPCFLPSLLSHYDDEHFQSIPPIAFSHSESLIKLQSPLPSILELHGKGKGQLFVTKCLSHSFTWQQSSTSFPTVKCQIWKPSIRLMFRVRLRVICNPESILQSNKSLYDLVHWKAFWQRIWTQGCFSMYPRERFTSNV